MKQAANAGTAYTQVGRGTETLEGVESKAQSKDEMDLNKKKKSPLDDYVILDDLG